MTQISHCTRVNRMDMREIMVHLASSARVCRLIPGSQCGGSYCLLVSIIVGGASAEVAAKRRSSSGPCSMTIRPAASIRALGGGVGRRRASHVAAHARGEREEAALD